MRSFATVAAAQAYVRRNDLSGVFVIDGKGSHDKPVVVVDAGDAADLLSDDLGRAGAQGLLARVSAQGRYTILMSDYHSPKRNPAPVQHKAAADKVFKQATDHLVDADKILTRTDGKGKVRVKGLHPLTKAERLDLVGHFTLAAFYLGAAAQEYKNADLDDKADLCDEYLLNVEKALIELAGGGPSVAAAFVLPE